MIGQTISHYHILEKIGQGGMGEVFLAEDTKLKRQVALKFLPRQMTADPEARERFGREAQAAAALNHPNIVTVYEIGEHEGQVFIAMEYVEGRTLKELIDSSRPPSTVNPSPIAPRPLPLPQVLDIAIQIASGLAVAHAKGIVHRDIKPQNILIDKSNHVKILDFGLAKLKGVSTLTKEASTQGTIHFMSPEQTMGKDVDQRTDIWSLGVMLYEMITGQPPFKGDYEQAVIYSILNEEPGSVTSIRNDIPPEFDRILEKVLAKEPEDRYQHVDDLLVDLKHFKRDSRPDRQPVPSAPRRKTRRWTRWGIPAALILLAAIAAILFFVLKGKPGTSVKPAAIEAKQGEWINSIAVLPFVDMSPQKDQEYFCDGMTEELINRLSNVQALRVPARTSAFFFKGKSDTIQEIGSKLNVQTVLEGSVQKAGGRLRITAQLINVADGYHLWSEKYDRKLEDVFAIQDEISSAIVNAMKLKLTPREAEKISEHPMDNIKAYECYLKAWRLIYRFDEKSINSAFEYLQTALDIMGDNAELYAGMAMAYSQRANIGIGQEEDLQRAEEYAKKALVLKPDLTIALVQLGNLAYYKEYPENMQDEFRYYKKALAVDPYASETLRGMAINYAILGKPALAQAFTDLYKRHDPLNPWCYAVKGLCDLYGCQFSLAIEPLHAFYQSDSTAPNTQALYSWALAADGQNDETLAVINQIEPATMRNVQTAFCLLLKYALLKDKENTARVMTPDFKKTCRRDCEWSYQVAARLSLLGAKEEALDWLENAISRGFINYPFLQCDPLLDKIRSEERFKKLMVKAKYEWEHFEVPE